jgi:predicted O-methyltransferase YrrM
MGLTEFLHEKGCAVIEGYSQQIPRQTETLRNLTNRPNIKVMEIGFNAGHSAETFLLHNDTLQLTSFDLGAHSYVKVGKEYIDKNYPNRHRLILGDSTKTVPKFFEENPTEKFDVIFIDGGHTYNIARQDLANCVNLSTPDTIVVMDDTCFKSNWVTHWTIGPTRTWVEHLEQNKIVELGREEYSAGRGMVWGKYLF